MALAQGAAAQEHDKQRLRDKIIERVKSKRSEDSKLSVIRDMAYGQHAAQKYDVYLPQAGVKNAPVIFMVHGGGWRHGDKTMARTVANKSADFTSRGWIFVSTNYRMLPDADPLLQAGDVAMAIAHAQSKATTWGGDPHRFVLMGHSAGAHLVALVTTKPEMVMDAGGLAWLATVGLDSGGYDIEAVMTGPHFKLYDDAFGADAAYWRATSPLAQMNAKIPPFLAVCSSQRKTPCPEALRFQKKAHQYGSTFNVLPVDLDHGDINDKLGLNNSYTKAVITFLKDHAGL